MWLALLVERAAGALALMWFLLGLLLWFVVSLPLAVIVGRAATLPRRRE